jgi:CheY-like chemotaxis protein
MSEERDQVNILVIDDDAALRGLLVDIITRRGHQAVPATSAEEGLELLPYWTFQVAFIDQKLPGMEGLVLGEYLRRNNPDMTIALVTGEHDTRLARLARELSITFINKPFDIHEIELVIDEYVTGAVSRRESRLRQEDPDYAPPIARYVSDLEKIYEIPGVPERIQDGLATTIKRCLNEIRSVSRYTEKDRVLALTGLVTARVLGVDLPKLPSGRTPYEEYDAIMRQHGRRTEFAEK